ncbi:Ribosomal large subunit pseudouridine synthaseC [Metamycoplasma auris 15026]|uniref:RNA pseudouridylate synthase n=1 Tax=Metamycoplasma auris 15026 TaxID=1188233 RepID=N9TTE4_9BACT|nr:RluA family pseudouridine synthase [Metamycoplasma auris]ENY69335.1 Ribosomal large subunit pseudouridine synthaseC [Metamycoplasma auris 15026]
MNKFIAKKDDVGRILYKYILIVCDNVPKSRIEKIFRQKDIKVNGIRTNDKQYKLQLGDEIIVYGLLEIKKPEKKNTANINFKVIYEDKNLLIIDKETNVAMHSEENCLDDQVHKYLNFKKTSSFVPSSIGRLDKKTSGLVVYAKNYPTLVTFEAAQKHFEKIYQFISENFNQEKLDITVRLEKDIKNEKMKVNPDFGIKAHTIFFKEGNRKFAQILTGKKHQIRATLEYLKAPILGDTKYGGKKAKRLYLHSYSIKFAALPEEYAEYNDQIFISYPRW